MTPFVSTSRGGALIAVAVCASACDGTDRATVDFVVRDSAGVEIVESGEAAFVGSDAWTIDPVPVLEIGTVDGDEPYVFTRVWDATRFPDGRIAVVDELALEIRIFDADGTHLLTFGGSGGGPEEFNGPPFVRAVDDNTLIAWDGGRARMSWFDSEGDLTDEVSLREALSGLGVFAFPNGRVWEIDAEGALLSTGPVRPERVEGIRESFRRVAIFQDRGSRNRDLGVYPAGQSFVVRLERMSIGVGNPYAPSTAAALLPGGRVAIGGDTGWEIRVVETDGTVTRVLRAAIPRAPVTAELERAGLERARDLAETSDLTLKQAEDAFGHLPLPDSVPAISTIEAAGETLWVGRRVGQWWETGDYDVFGADGQWLTTLSLPRDVENILEIGPEYLLAQVRDDLDVQYLRMYRMRRPVR